MVFGQIVNIFSFIEYIEEISKSVDNKKCYQWGLNQFKKAFDTTNHGILIKKLWYTWYLLQKLGYKVIYKTDFNLSILVIQSQNC